MPISAKAAITEACTVDTIFRRPGRALQGVKSDDASRLQRRISALGASIQPTADGLTCHC